MGVIIDECGQCFIGAILRIPPAEDQLLCGWLATAAGWSLVLSDWLLLGDCDGVDGLVGGSSRMTTTTEAESMMNDSVAIIAVLCAKRNSLTMTALQLFSVQ